MRILQNFWKIRKLHSEHTYTIKQNKQRKSTSRHIIIIIKNIKCREKLKSIQRETCTSLQLLGHVRLFATPWTATRQVSLSITNSWSWWNLSKLMSIESCPLSPWCHATVSSSVIPFYSCLQSFPASGSFPMS